MGNNAAFNDWEHTVITLRKHNVLTQEILDEISKHQANTDIDEGGMNYTEVDGYDVKQICVLVYKPDFQSDDYDEWCDEFYELSGNRWGWR